MKTILLLLLTCLPLCAATTYPMLSDTTNRTVTGGVTNMSFLNSNSVFTGTARWMGIVTLTNTGNIFVGSGAGLTGVGVATSGGLATNATIYGLTINTGSTNTHLTASSVVVTDANKGIVSGTTTADLAKLSANQTFTGTNTFPAASFYPANNIGMRLLWSSPTNIYLPTLSTFANPTNNGNYANITAIGKITLPALIGTNSWVFLTWMVERTNANTTAGSLYLYLGSNTNFIGSWSGAVATSVGKSGLGLSQAVFANEGSFTNQRQHGGYAAPIIWGTSNFVDTSVAWDMYLGMATVTGCTNALFPRMAIYELPQ